MFDQIEKNKFKQLKSQLNIKRKKCTFSRVKLQQINFRLTIV